MCNVFIIKNITYKLMLSGALDYMYKHLCLAFILKLACIRTLVNSSSAQQICLPVQIRMYAELKYMRG